MTIPAAVYVIWWVVLIVTIVAVVPLVVFLLHRTLTAARQIERYAATALEAGVGIAGNTANIAALEQTISAATDVLAAAESVELHTGAIEDALAARAGV